MDVQILLVKVAMVKVVVAAGLTFTVITGAVPLKVVPSERVPEMVPVPVTAKDNVAVPGSHIAVVPLSAAVGRWLTVTVAVPVSSAAMAIQVPLVKVAIV